MSRELRWSGIAVAALALTLVVALSGSLAAFATAPSTRSAAPPPDNPQFQPCDRTIWSTVGSDTSQNSFDGVT